MWYFDLSMSLLGRIQIDVELKNEVSNEKISTYATVSNFDCGLPEISILNRRPLFYAPFVQPRSSLLFISTQTKITCQKSLWSTRKWFVYKIDAKTGLQKTKVELIDNPTVGYSDLVIKPNTLDIGLYRFVYTVSMFDANVPLDSFQTESDTYINIEQSGIIVNGFENGMLEIKRGLKQDIYIDPVMYSYSLDSLVSMSGLKFRFYCSVIDDGLVKSAPFVAVDKKIDLMTFKNDEKYGNFLTCFNSTGKFKFFIDFY